MYGTTSLRDLRRSLHVFEDSSPHGRHDREEQGFRICRNVGKMMFRLLLHVSLSKFSVKETSYSNGNFEKL